MNAIPPPEQIAAEKAEAINMIERSVYEACALFEQLELAGKVRGNGHHMAQNIAEQAGKLMQERWIESVAGSAS